MKNGLKDKKLISFSDYFRYRNVWLFLAILWVMLFHSYVWVSGGIRLFKDVGYGGVDIFLFASGIGCYYSLSKQADVKRFLQKRMAKILPMQLIFMGIYILYENSIAPMRMIEMIGNITGMGFFAGLDRQFNWYLGGMWICYLLAPVFMKLARDTKLKNSVLIILGICVISTVFFDQFELIFWSRLPVFFLGMVMADYSMHNAMLTVRQGCVMILWMLIGAAVLEECYFKYGELLWAYGLWWYPFLLITPGLTLVISLIAKWIDHSAARSVVHWMDRLGQHTFPVYLSHIFIFKIYGRLVDTYGMRVTSANKTVSVAVIVLLAVMLHYAAEFADYVWKRAVKHSGKLIF